jgi:MFS family permease
MASGLIGLFIWIPIFFFMLPGGMMADRYNRKLLVLACNLLFAICACGLAVADRFPQPITVIFIFLFVIGIARAFSDPPKNALLPELVPQEHFTNAIAWNSNIFQIASVAGPALGGLLYSWLGFTWVCGIDVMIEALFFICIVTVRQTQTSYKREPISLDSLKQGLKFVRDTKLILATITMDLFAVILGGATALFPAFDEKILHCGALGVGLLQTAIALGAFSTSFLVAHLPLKRAGVTLLWAVAGYGIVTILFGLSHWYWFSFGLMFLAGAFDNISVVVRHTLVQVLTPDTMRGRITSVSYIFIHSSNELGGFESGAVAALVGLVPSVILGGIGSLLVVWAVTQIWPEVAKIKTLSANQLPTQRRQDAN